jgi:hypothetical protein
MSMERNKGVQKDAGCLRGVRRRRRIALGWEFMDTTERELSGSCIIAWQIKGVTGAFIRIHERGL